MALKIARRADETSLSLINRFSKGVRRSGLLRTVMKNRHHHRSESQLTKKRTALRKNKSRQKYQELKKLGKI